VEKRLKRTLLVPERDNRIHLHGLRAGTAQATTATINNTSATPLNVAQSLGFTPYKTLAINRVSPNPAIIPQAIPRNVARKPSFNSIWKMSPLTAPSATRIPISRVRCCTVYEIDPYKPIVASANARAAKLPIKYDG
jgi:hypothetical protein